MVDLTVASYLKRISYITLTEFKRKYLHYDLVCRQLNVTRERREKLVKNGRRERKKQVRRKAKRRTKT